MKIYYKSEDHGLFCSDEMVRSIIATREGLRFVFNSLIGSPSELDYFTIPMSSESARKVIGMIPNAFKKAVDTLGGSLTEGCILFIDIDEIYNSWID